MTEGQWFKVACVAVYGVIVGLATWVSSGRSDQSQNAKTPESIGAERYVKESDLRAMIAELTQGQNKVHAYLVYDRAPSEDVAPASKTAKIFNGVAIAVTVSKREAAALMAPENAAQLCLNGKELGKPAHTVSSVCDDSACLLTIPLAPIPKDLNLSAAEGRLTATPGGGPCGAKAAGG